MAAPLVTPAAADIIRRARERIATPERWMQGYFSADEHGDFAGASPASWGPGTSLCVDGAVMAGNYELRTANKTPWAGTAGAGLCVSMVAKSRGFETASKFNDAPATTHADVLGFLDEAIALAESLAGAES